MLSLSSKYSVQGPNAQSEIYMLSPTGQKGKGQEILSLKIKGEAANQVSNID